MKISMTNSDRGLGKVISDRFDNVVEGFDEDSDVFINNRHYYFSGQAELLMEVFEKWRYKKKTIVNIISRSKYPNISKGYLYSASKAAVSHLSDNLRLTTDKECRIIDINPGLLNSDLPSLTYSEITDIIVYTIKLPFHIEVGELSVWHNTSYQKISKMKDEKKLSK
tara:strand:+ start:95 stop:595 length:501 start_codon:yes stop_codon:yes gene_type:complete